MYKKLVCILAIGCMCLTACSSKETAKNEPEIVEEKEEDYTQTTEINEKQVIDEEEQDETKTALDKVLEDKLPYISYTNTKLGKDASEFLNSTSDILVSIDNTGVTSSYYLKDDDTIDYYMENNQRYIVGVSDDIVSVYAISATECVSAGVQVKDVFNGLDVDTPPYDIKVDTNCSLYLWRIDGGYLAVHVANVGNTSFLEKYVNHVVYLSNAEYKNINYKLRPFLQKIETLYHIKNIKSWNWGAFMFVWIWGLFNKIYWPLLIVPLFFLLRSMMSIIIVFFITIGTILYLGRYGNALAWNKRKDTYSMEQFLKQQNKWSLIGFVLLCIDVVAWGIYVIV